MSFMKMRIKMQMPTKRTMQLLAVLACLALLYYFLYGKGSWSYGKVLEGYTSCTQIKSCKECVSAGINDTSSPCYWNKDSTGNRCSAFQDEGYKSTCDADADDPPEPDKNPYSPPPGFDPDDHLDPYPFPHPHPHPPHPHPPHPPHPFPPKPPGPDPKPIDDGCDAISRIKKGSKFVKVIDEQDLNDPGAYVATV